MNNQEAFNIAARHLLKQGRRSVIEPQLSCAYRGADGLKCAVGALIPDELYEPRFEGIGVGTLKWKEPTFREHFAGVSVWVLNELQHVHDLKPPETWRTELQRVGQKYQLDTSVLDEVPA